MYNQRPPPFQQPLPPHRLYFYPHLHFHHHSAPPPQTNFHVPTQIIQQQQYYYHTQRQLRNNVYRNNSDSRTYQYRQQNTRSMSDTGIYDTII